MSAPRPSDLMALVTLWRERAALWESRGEPGPDAYVSPMDWKKDALEAKRCANELAAAVRAAGVSPDTERVQAELEGIIAHLREEK